MRALIAGLVLLTLPASAAAQGSPFYSHDNHTEYQLLDPATHQFAIVYFVTERRAGATLLINQTRSGSAGSDVAVFDPATGKPLKFEYVSGAEMTADGTPGRFDAQEHYIRAHLPRPVPEGGEGRVKILKTYLDEKSYYTEGEDIVFKRSLGIARNAITLPKGYALVSSNVAAQVYANEDGRVKVAFEHDNGYAADVTIRARKSSAAFKPAAAFVDRSFDFSKTMFDLGLPETHIVKVTHEYLEQQQGPRSRVTLLESVALDNPTVTDVDTGKALKTTREKDTTFAALETAIGGPNQSARLRVAGAMSDPKYRLDGSELVWEHALQEPRVTIVLPMGWELAAVSVPATVSAQPDGRVVVQVFEGRPASVTNVVVRAVHR